jgi:hypothetical protein
MRLGGAGIVSFGPAVRLEVEPIIPPITPPSWPPGIPPGIPPMTPPEDRGWRRLLLSNHLYLLRDPAGSAQVPVYDAAFDAPPDFGSFECSRRGGGGGGTAATRNVNNCCLGSSSVNMSGTMSAIPNVAHWKAKCDGGAGGRLVPARYRPTAAGQVLVAPRETFAEVAKPRSAFELPALALR